MSDGWRCAKSSRAQDKWRSLETRHVGHSRCWVKCQIGGKIRLRQCPLPHFMHSHGKDGAANSDKTSNAIEKHPVCWGGGKQMSLGMSSGYKNGLPNMGGASCWESVNVHTHTDTSL